MQVQEICVVGGGLSGLNFAAKSSQVLAEGTRVSLIEARNAAGVRTLRSAQTHSPMQELGAFFFYDKDIYNQLMSTGAQVRILQNEDFYLARHGSLEHCGKERGPFGIIDSIACELSLLPNNISIEQALQQNECSTSRWTRIHVASFDVVKCGDCPCPAMGTSNQLVRAHPSYYDVPWRKSGYSPQK